MRLGRRDPAIAFLFPVLFPVFMIGLFSQVYRNVAQVPGFPATNYVTWIAPGVLLMAAMFGAGHSALGLVTDAQTGFLDRLRLLPVSPAALLLGRLLFDVARVTVAGLLVLVVTVALGANLAGGIPGVAGTLILLALWTLAYGGLYYAVGLKSLKPEALAGLVPLFLPISLLSTAYIPRDLLPRWVQIAASLNPYTYVVEGVRHLMTGTADLATLAAAAAAATLVIALTQYAAAHRFNRLITAD
jgi:ABC-2 type transport system permease protein